MSEAPKVGLRKEYIKSSPAERRAKVRELGGIGATIQRESTARKGVVYKITEIANNGYIFLDVYHRNGTFLKKLNVAQNPYNYKKGDVVI